MRPRLLLLSLAVAALSLAGSPTPNPYTLLPAAAQKTQDRKAEEDQVLQQCRQDLQNNQNEAAVKSCDEALAIFRQLKNRDGEAKALNNLGTAYRFLSQYEKAIAYYQEALPIFVQVKDKNAEANALMNLGNAYLSLSQYEKAITYYQQALPIFVQVKDKNSEAKVLMNLGSAYRVLSEYEKAITYYQQALPIFVQVKDKNSEANILMNLGIAYLSLSQYEKAITYYQQALPIFIQVKDKNGEANILMNLGTAYRVLSEYEKAITYYQQALPIFVQVKDRSGEGLIFSNIGNLFQEQNQPELAIVFYKQSVNVRESIRQDIRKLDRTLQESYTQSVAGTYRSLADLLLSQGRVLEAQQVLELLKIQELRDFTRDTRAGGETQGAPLNAVEASVKPPFDTLIALGAKLTDCENQRPRCAEREQLLAQRKIAEDKFAQQADRLRRLARQQTNKDPAQLQQAELTVAAAKIVQAQPKTVLIYPLVLEDKLWLVYGVQAGKAGVAFASQEIPVSRKELSATVAQFRALLENPRSDVKQLQQVSQKLYGWLIAPLRPQLEANGIQNLVFSLDRSTRYMPVVALFDGQNYLVERFTISTILTAGLTDTSDKLSSNPADNPVLGLGLSDPVSGFNPLPNVPAEIDAIVRLKSADANGVFAGSEYLNRDFTLNALKDLIDYRILHIATHGKFVSEDPEQSFLVLGNGDRLKVPDIRKLSDLGSIHLAVLSACETAKGGQDKEGVEVAGLSYYFLTQNVKSVIASLWLVNDASTALMMQQFYKQLATGKVTKAEALRQAQLALLQGKVTAKDAPQRSDIQVTVEPGTRTTQERSSNFSHPYYWAPFTLIGNSL